MISLKLVVFPQLSLPGRVVSRAPGRPGITRPFQVFGRGCLAAGHSAAERAAPMIDLGQASHPHLYSKLFQS